MRSAGNMSQDRYESLVRLVMRELRGRKTQLEMSRCLGYRFNQWHKWESGLKTVTWKDLRKIAVENARLQKSLDEALRLILDSSAVRTASGGTVLKTILNRYGGIDIALTREKLGISQATLYRLTKPRSDVALSLIFRSLGELSTGLPVLIAGLVDLDKNALLRSEISEINRKINLNASTPWLAAIEAFLETDDYGKARTHSDRQIAMQLGFTSEQVQIGLRLLLETEMIERVGMKYQLKIKRLDLLSLSDSGRFAKYWTEIAKRRHETIDHVPRSRRGWGTRVFPVSEEANDAIVKLRVKLWEDIQNVLQKDGTRPKTKVKVFLEHYFDHTEFKDLFK